MRFPHPNFPQGWSLTAGYGFGAPTSYGFHEAIDVNDKGGGDSDLGKPIYAEADGTIVSLHMHTGKPNFGNHYFLEVNGEWGTKYFHHAHCNQIYVKVGQKVKEGDLLATIGKSGTDYAHDHWALTNHLNPDNIANTKDELLGYWEDPIAFIEKWKSDIIPPVDTLTKEQLVIDAYQALCGEFPTDDEKRYLLGLNYNTMQILSYLTGDQRFKDKFAKEVPYSPHNPTAIKLFEIVKELDV